MGNTVIDLVQDLEKKLASPMRPVGELNTKNYERGIKAIIAYAKIGYYHDFITPLGAPKIELHTHLLQMGLGDIDKKMQNGDYDDESPSDKIEDFKANT